MTLLLSYLIFTKPLTEQHGSGLLLIAMGIILKMVPENKSTKKALTSSAHGAEELRVQSEYAGEDEDRRPLV